MNMVKRLFRGSQKVDEAKKEIDTVFQIILGAVDRINSNKPERGKGVEFCFGYQFVYWRLYVAVYPPTNRKATVACDIKGVVEYMAEHGRPSKFLSTETLEFVRKSMDGFVKEIFRVYPELKDECRPYLRFTRRFRIF